MATKAEIRQRVGEDLALVPIGQALENQDKTRIDAAYGEVYARLKTKGLAIWASTADVPEELVPSLCLMIEEKLLTSYSVPDTRYVRIKGDAGPNGDLAEAMLAELIVDEHESISDVTDF